MQWQRRLCISSTPPTFIFFSFSSTSLSIHKIMVATKLSALALLTLAAAAPSSSPSKAAPLTAAISSIFPQGGAPLTPQILKTFLEPNEANIARNSYVYRDGTTLRLFGDRWTASGANVYWLGLDENVIPPAGEPFYEPFNASYPTQGRITEVMSTLVTMGARLIRSQTLGVSVGNPLSLMPTLGVVNEQAFATMDWAVFQARQHGLRIMAPLTDNYVSFNLYCTAPR
jgi:mannan endo-1,4-beta-mannosidase